MTKPEYRGQDTILEMIKALHAGSSQSITWNEACETVADNLEIEGLACSAEAARGHRD